MSGRVVVVGMFVLGISLGAIAFLFAPRLRLRPASPAASPVVAVLPFENRSSEPDLEILAASIAPAVVRELETSGRVQTVASEASSIFRDAEGGIARVAAALDADYVIAGSLDRDRVADEIVVDAYLYRAGADQALWAERLAWTAAAADEIATELARRIAGSLTAR